MTATSQVSWQFELDKNTAEAEVWELRQKLADITNQEEDDNSEEAPPSKWSQTNDVDQDENDEETLVTSTGDCFVMLYSLWLWHGEAMFKVEYNPELDEAGCFESADNKIQEEVQEIKIVLRAQLSGKMSSEPWIAKVMSQPFE